MHRAPRKVLAAALAATVAAGTVVLGGPAQAAEHVTVTLPAPTGPYAVGVETAHLVDEGRADPWLPERDRELMLSVWYPAYRGGGEPAPYLSAEESALLLEAFGIGGKTLTVEAHARADATPLPKRAPLVLLSPGYGFPRSSLTAVAEELASRGYIAVGIDHTYENHVQTFPDGRVVTCEACRIGGDGTKTSAGRALDVSFVLDELIEPGGELYRRWPIDARHIGMAGHSIGGSGAVRAMLGDERIDAGVNADGTVFPALDAELDRPFMLVGTEDHAPGASPDDTSWDESWTRLTGDRYWLTITGSNHSTVADYTLLAEALDVPGVPGQDLPGYRGLDIARAYLNAFFDRHLKGRAGTLLDGPSDRYPEAVLH